MHKNRLCMLLCFSLGLPLNGMEPNPTKKPLVFTPASIRCTLACCALLKQMPHATPQALNIVYEREIAKGLADRSSREAVFVEGAKKVSAKYSVNKPALLLTGFGTFAVMKRNSRFGINPTFHAAIRFVGK